LSQIIIISCLNYSALDSSFRIQCGYLLSYIVRLVALIVRFKSYRAKDELYRARKHLKSVSLNNYFHNTKAVYINENLTSYGRSLFAQVRKFRKDNQ